MENIEICVWKSITERNEKRKAEGINDIEFHDVELEECKKCNGYNTNCSRYSENNWKDA